jgi:hypothetical protein
VAREQEGLTVKWSVNVPSVPGHFWVRYKDCEYVTIAMVSSSEKTGRSVRVLIVDGWINERDYFDENTQEDRPSRWLELGRLLWGDRVTLPPAKGTLVWNWFETSSDAEGNKEE